MTLTNNTYNPSQTNREFLLSKSGHVQWHKNYYRWNLTIIQWTKTDGKL